jgi:hypothetical protein
VLSANLLRALVNRLKEARAKNRLESLLRRVKQGGEVLRRKFRVSGSIDELAEAVQIAAQEGLLTADVLASLVDEVEENGAQHIFLFDLTDAGAALARSRTLKRAFQPLPNQPTPAMYAELPTATRTYISERPEGIVIKQIGRAMYWEKDEDRSYEREDERAVFIVRRQRRAINLLRLDPARKRAEVRIDRVRGLMDDRLAITLFTQFRTAIQPEFDFEANMAPVQIWRGFTRIVADKVSTYMSTDGAKDPSVSVQISNRRERDRGPDVRDHPAYRYTGEEYVRDTLNVYWRQDNGEKIHTVLSRVKAGDKEYGKIYVAAKLDPSELTNVVDSIRQFALEAS